MTDETKKSKGSVSFKLDPADLANLERVVAHENKTGGPGHVSNSNMAKYIVREYVTDVVREMDVPLAEEPST